MTAPDRRAVEPGPDPAPPDGYPDGYELLDVGGVHIAHRVIGAGETLVLVHSGTGSGEFDWRHQVPALADSYRVVLLDQRGHARSSDGPITVETLTADLDAVCRHVDAYPAHFLAASHGSFPVLRLALQRPDDVRSVAVVGSVWDDDHLPEEHDAGLVTRWPGALRRLHERHGPQHWADLLQRLIDDRRANVRFTEAEFRALRCPVLVAQGDRDEFLDVAMSARAAAWAGGELLVLPGAGHAAHIEFPELFNMAYLGFLDRAARAAGRAAAADCAPDPSAARPPDRTSTVTPSRRMSR